MREFGRNVDWDQPPIPGDLVPAALRLKLDAVELGFVHPETGERVSFESVLAPELQAVLDRLGPPDEDRSASVIDPAVR